MTDVDPGAEGLSVLDKIRRDHQAREEAREQAWAEREHLRSVRKTAARDREVTTAAYREGRRAERERAEKRRRPAKTTAGRRPVAKARRRQVRQAFAPVAGQVGSGLRFLAMSVAVAGLYLALTAEEDTHAFSGALGGLSKALRWFSDPTASIKFGD